MNYYVYILAYPNGTVFYVGKDCGNRVAEHEKEALPATPGWTEEVYRARGE